MKITDWQKDVRDYGQAGLKNFIQGFALLEGWDAFQGQYPEMKILKTIIEEELKRENAEGILPQH